MTSTVDQCHRDGTRWLFEQFEFPFEVIYPETLDRGNLKTRVDVLVLSDGAFRRGGWRTR